MAATVPPIYPAPPVIRIFNVHLRFSYVYFNSLLSRLLRSPYPGSGGFSVSARNDYFIGNGFPGSADHSFPRSLAGPPRPGRRANSGFGASDQKAPARHYLRVITRKRKGITAKL